MTATESAAPAADQSAIESRFPSTSTLGPAAALGPGVGWGPPLTLGHLVRRRREALVAAAGAALVLAGLAWFRGGAALLSVDAPVARWIAGARTPAATTFFNASSHIGDNAVVFAIAAALALTSFRRCRPLALAIVAAVLVRPGMEFVLKAVVGRPRPGIAPLAHFHGPSHPSGHPLAAASVLGLFPAWLSVHVPGRRAWWAAAGAAVTLIVLVAAARVYKGAHYLSDVSASLVWAGLYLAAVQGVFERFHRAPACLHVHHRPA